MKFVNPLDAEQCLKVMDGRFFDGRSLKAYYWDGKTDYRVTRETADD